MITSKQSGISLVELLVALVIISIGFCFIVPFSLSLYKKNQSEVIRDTIKSAVHYAEMQTLISGETLILRARSGSTDWSSGMILSVENTTHQTAATGAQVLYEWRWPSHGVQVSWHGCASQHYLRFTPDISHRLLTGHFLITTAVRDQKTIVINRLGRIR